MIFFIQRPRIKNFLIKFQNGKINKKVGDTNLNFIFMIKILILSIYEY